MVHALVGYGVEVLEVGLLALIVRHGQCKRLIAAFVLVSSIVLVDALRQFVIYRYGWTSDQYYYFYWLSNVFLQLAALLLVCYLFHAVFARHKKWWDVLKLALPMVFVLVVAVSLFSVWRPSAGISSQLAHTNGFAVFEQYLYFTCLILNTLLFVAMQYVESADAVLPMLVCGLGLEFAGPAANMALVVLAPRVAFAAAYLEQASTLAMLVVWMYAVKRAAERVPEPKPNPMQQVLAA